MGTSKKPQSENILAVKRDCSVFEIKPGESSIFAKDSHFANSSWKKKIEDVSKVVAGGIIINRRKNEEYRERKATSQKQTDIKYFERKLPISE